MLYSRRIGAIELFQITEFTGPTHDAQWMLPGLSRETLDAHVSWLSPGFWLPHTNRLIFTMQLFVLKMSDRIIIIDTGVGNHKTRRAGSHHMLNTPMSEWLEGIGAEPDKVTHVVQTHLHGDHVGWNTSMVDGRWEPFFPNATYYFPVTDFAVFKSRYESGSGIFTAAHLRTACSQSWRRPQLDSSAIAMKSPTVSSRGRPPAIPRVN
jgi:glyoxylase-like metal-dependent hydrolase (beta-lactamase superfamily II)